MSLSQQEREYIEATADASAQKALEKLLMLLGVQLNDQDSIDSFQADRGYLRKMRLADDARAAQRKQAGWAFAVGVAVAAAGAWASGLLHTGGK